MKQGIEHLYFDLDHTLWDFDRNAEETLMEMYHHFELGLGIDKTFDDFHETYRTINHKYWADYVQGKVNQEQLRLGRFRDALKAFGLVTGPDPEELSAYYVSECPKKPHLIEGAIEVLTDLKERYAMHIITNGFKEVQHVKLHTSGIASFFEEICTSEDAGVKKPDPKIFSYIFNKVGAKASSGVMIGDNVKTDIQGGVNAGLKTIFFNPMKTETPHEATVEIASLKQLSSLL